MKVNGMELTEEDRVAVIRGDVLYAQKIRTLLEDNPTAEPADLIAAIWDMVEPITLSEISRTHPTVARAIDRDEFVEMYRRGDSLERIGEHFGVSMQSAARAASALRAEGVDLPSRAPGAGWRRRVSP